jgi:RNA polymerase sigma-70 factor (ECF subfamily)
MERTDQQLLSSIASGDSGAFAAFYDRHAGRVLGLLRRWLGHPDSAEDVLQETFWQVWRRAGQYDARRSPPEAWLVLLARSRALDHLRRQPPPAASAWPEPAATDEPGSALERSESAELVRRALSQLPAEQRSAITLAFFAGLTYEQVAREQAIPVGTAKTRIRLGMRRLRDLLGEEAKGSLS